MSTSTIVCDGYDAIITGGNLKNFKGSSGLSFTRDCFHIACGSNIEFQLSISSLCQCTLIIDLWANPVVYMDKKLTYKPYQLLINDKEFGTHPMSETISKDTWNIPASNLKVGDNKITISLPDALIPGLPLGASLGGMEMSIKKITVELNTSQSQLDSVPISSQVFSQNEVQEFSSSSSIKQAGDILGISYTKSAAIKLSPALNLYHEYNNIISGTDDKSRHAFYLYNENCNYWLGAGHNGDWKKVMCAYPKDSNWHYVAVSYDIKEKLMKLYLDGVLCKQATSVEPYSTIPNNKTLIGGYNNENAFNGQIDKVQIWNKALTDEQVKIEHQHKS